MALKDLWQQRRQERQDELAMRQHTVRAMLTMSQKERQAAAALLRDDLTLFRASLTQAEQIRLVAAQDLQAERQADRQQRAQEIHTFLAETHEQRQIKAQQVAQELSQFVQSLQQSTADFLALTGAERELMAHQLDRDLQAFRQALNLKVETLRQTLQIDIKTLQTETQLFLYQSQQERLRRQIQLSQELATFIDRLRTDGQNHLTKLAVMRQDRAVAVAEMLEQSRADRLVEVAALFARCADFRTQLQTYRTGLSTLVWGNAGEEVPTITPPQTTQATPKATPPTPAKSQPKAAKSANLPAPAETVAPVPAKSAMPKVTAPEATEPKASFGKIKSAAKPAATASKPVIEPIAPEPEKSLLNLDELSQVVGAFSDESLLSASVTATATQTPAPKTPVTNPQAPEADQILQYLSQVEGARLTEIESALGLSRFKTVDTLRSLIRDGSITQRDRQYVLPA